MENQQCIKLALQHSQDLKQSHENPLSSDFNEPAYQQNEPRGIKNQVFQVEHTPQQNAIAIDRGAINRTIDHGQITTQNHNSNLRGIKWAPGDLYEEEHKSFSINNGGHNTFGAENSISDSVSVEIEEIKLQDTSSYIQNTSFEGEYRPDNNINSSPFNYLNEPLDMIETPRRNCEKKVSYNEDKICWKGLNNNNGSDHPSTQPILQFEETPRNIEQIQPMVIRNSSASLSFAEYNVTEQSANLDIIVKDHIPRKLDQIPLMQPISQQAKKYYQGNDPHKPSNLSREMTPSNEESYFDDLQELQDSSDMAPVFEYSRPAVKAQFQSLFGGVDRDERQLFNDTRLKLLEESVNISSSSINSSQIQLLKLKSFIQEENKSEIQDDQRSYSFSKISSSKSSEKSSKKEMAQVPLKKLKTFQYDESALYFFHKSCFLRVIIVKIVESKVFEYTMIFIIFLNSLALALFNYQDKDSQTENNQMIDKANIVFTAVFLVEAILRIVTQGLIMHKNAYLRVGWNIIDATVVISGLMEIGLGSVNFKALRVVRIFRPLKSINSIPSMKKLISALIHSIPEFAHVAAFLIFVFIIFSTMGMHQYNGAYYNACRYTSEPGIDQDYWPADLQINRVCTVSGLGNYMCPDSMTCGNPADYMQISLETENMTQRAYTHYGITNFDNLGTSFLTIFQIVTSDTWYQQLCNVMDADIPILGVAYIFAIIIIGQFFLMNLILAVIIYAFIKSQKEELQREINAFQVDEDRKQNLIQTVVALSSPVTNQAVAKIAPAQGLKKQKPQKNSQRRHSVIHSTFNFNAQKIQSENEKISNNNERNNLGIFLKSQATRRKVANLFIASGKSRMIKKVSQAIESKEQSEMKLSDIFKEDSKKQDDEKNQESIKSQYSSSQEIQKSISSNSIHIGDSSNSALSGPNSVVQKLGQLNSFQNPLFRMKQLPFEGQEDAVQNEQEELKEYDIELNIVEESKEDDDEDDNFSSMLEKRINNNIENQYEDYFKTILKEAKDNPNPESSNMREIVGIKVGLQFIKKQTTLREGIYVERNNVKIRLNVSKTYKIAHAIIDSEYFASFIALSIIANTIVLSLDKYPIDTNRTNLIEKINYFFTAVFLLEVILKFIALGIKNFFKGSWLNTFDLIIVIGSIIDLAVSYFLILNGNNKTGSVTTALRGFRLLRVFKLARSWRKLELLLETLINTLKDVAVFSILLSLFMFIFTLLGLELFAGNAKFDPITNELDLTNGESPEFNFDNFLNSFTLVFILLTNDGSSAIYYNYYRAVGGATSTIFFVLVLVIGQKILLNVFVAILLENFDEAELKQKMLQFEEKQREVNTRVSIFTRFKKWFSLKVEQAANGCRSKKVADGEYTSQVSRSFTNKLQLGLKQSERKKIDDNLGDSSKRLKIVGTSLNIFGPKSRFRTIIFDLVQNNHFFTFVILIILVSAVQLALDSPLTDPKSSLANTLFWFDVGITILFILEALLKIIAYGLLFNGDSSYLRQQWNQLDIMIIVFSLMALSPLSDNFKAFKVFRILRIISRNEGLKIAVRALVCALPNIGSITVIMLLFFLIFGVISVSQFKGKFFECSNDIPIPDFEINSKWDCLNGGGSWDNRVYTFDDIPNAVLTLFVMATTAGWQDVLMASIKSTNIDYVIGEDRSAVWTFYYILFMIVGFLFFLNLFIGVVVTTFNQEQDRIGGNNLLTEKQREWIELKLLVFRAAPIKRIRKPENKIRLFFYHLSEAQTFQNFIFISILGNTLVLTLKWYRQDVDADNAFEIINYVFTAIFMAESIIKITAQGFRVYFKEDWNRFDFIVAIGSFISILISVNTSIQIKGATTLLRTFRVLRILRILKQGGRSLHMIFNTFIITLTQLSNIGGLLLLIIFMYSVLGMILFGTNKRNGIMNDYLNFENFFNAFITLFIVTTGDSWDKMQASYIIDNIPQNLCIWNPSYQDYIDNGSTTIGCGGKVLSYLFFTSFFFIVGLIFLQLFIAILLQGYDSTQVQEARLFNNSISQKFREAWADQDPDATTFINLVQIRDFLIKLGEPLGFDTSFKGEKFLQDKFIASLELPTYFDFSKYQFLDVLDALSFRLMVIDHIKKQNILPEQPAPTQETTLNKGTTNLSSDLVGSNLEYEVKSKIEKEINTLIFQNTSDSIKAFKDVENIQSKKRAQSHFIDSKGLTSSHHMAAEATIRKMRNYLRLCHLKRKEELMEDQREIARARVKTISRMKTSQSIPSYNRVSLLEEKLPSYFFKGPNMLMEEIQEESKSLEDEIQQ